MQVHLSLNYKTEIYKVCSVLYLIPVYNFKD